MEEVRALFDLVTQILSNFTSVDWSIVNYRQSVFALRVGYFLAGLIFIKIVWRRYRSKHKSVYFHSGFDFDSKDKPGLIHKILRSAAYLGAIAGTCLVLTALADPYTIIAQKSEQVELREVVYVRDASSSMGFRFKSQNLTRADITQDLLNNLIAKRKDRGDRSAYIVFGTEASIWSGFTTSTESLLFTIGTAPRIFASLDSKRFWPGIFIANDFTRSDNGGKTNLHLGLQRAIYLFDSKGSPEITKAMATNPSAHMRSVIIITDGAAEQDPEPQFVELRKRRIIPYLVFIDPAMEAEIMIHGPGSIKTKLPGELLLMVRRYGGQYFLAKDKYSIENISSTLDKMQTIKRSVPTKSKERDIYYIPLAFGLLVCIGVILLRLITWRLWRTI